MGKVTKVLLLLKDMIYESTSPLEIIRFAKYYRSKGHLRATRIGNVNFYTRESLGDFLKTMTNLTYERRKR